MCAVSTTTGGGRRIATDDLRHAQRPDFMNECARLPVVAKRYGVSLTKVYDWLDDGLPSFRVGREHLVHIPTADAWVAARLTGIKFVSPMGRRSGEGS